MNINEDLSKLVYGWKTKYKEGFMPNELEKIVDMFPQLHMNKYNSAMLGNTCTMHEGNFCIYHCDVLHALRCGLEDRDLTFAEWD